VLQPQPTASTHVRRPGEVDLFKFYTIAGERTADGESRESTSTSATQSAGPDGQLLILEATAPSTDDPGRNDHEKPNAGDPTSSKVRASGATGALHADRSAEFSAGHPPLQARQVGSVGELAGLGTGDFNGDGFSDLAKSRPNRRIQSRYTWAWETASSDKRNRF